MQFLTFSATNINLFICCGIFLSVFPQSQPLDHLTNNQKKTLTTYAVELTNSPPAPPTIQRILHTNKL